MAANVRQKIATLDINAQTEQTIRDYLALGYVLHQITVLPTENKLLIVYYDPAVEE